MNDYTLVFDRDESALESFGTALEHQKSDFGEVKSIFREAKICSTKNLIL